MKLKVLFVSLIISCVSFLTMAQQESHNQGEVKDSLDIALGVLWNENFAQYHQNLSYLTLFFDHYICTQRNTVTLMGSKLPA